MFLTMDDASGMGGIFFCSQATIVLTSYRNSMCCIFLLWASNNTSCTAASSAMHGYCPRLHLRVYYDQLICTGSKCPSYPNLSCFFLNHRSHIDPNLPLWYIHTNFLSCILSAPAVAQLGCFLCIQLKLLPLLHCFLDHLLRFPFLVFKMPCTSSFPNVPIGCIL